MRRRSGARGGHQVAAVRLGGGGEGPARPHLEALLLVLADRTDHFWSNERSISKVNHLSVINEYMSLA